jgi:hypothetical protein
MWRAIRALLFGVSFFVFCYQRLTSAMPFADAETIIQQLSRSMLANRLLLSLPESSKWIDPSSVAIALGGFGPPLSLFFHLQNKLPFLQTSLGVLVPHTLVMMHEWLHSSPTKLSCPVWQRLHQTFKSQPIRLESSPGWPRFVQTRLDTTMKIPTGIHASHAFSIYRRHFNLRALQRKRDGSQSGMFLH